MLMGKTERFQGTCTLLPFLLIAIQIVMEEKARKTTAS